MEGEKSPGSSTGTPTEKDEGKLSFIGGAVAYPLQKRMCYLSPMQEIDFAGVVSLVSSRTQIGLPRLLRVVALE
jgi:hypothetical protein